jgi:homogentisate 1,2-dioxygenase
MTSHMRARDAPQPSGLYAAETSIGAVKTEELAVMVDTFKPLQLTADALECEKTEYMASWLAGDAE